MLWSLLFVLLIDACRCSNDACKCPKGERICPEGKPACPQDEPACPQDFPVKPESDWILSQSSDVENNKNYNTEKAVDGTKTSCTNKNTWWMIDLQGLYDISSIAIYGKENEDLCGAQIYIGSSCENYGRTNKLVTNITDFKTGCWNLYQTNTLGCYITVSHPRKKDFSLCEVRINTTKKGPGQCPDDFDFDPTDSWITSQSSDYTNDEGLKYNSTRAIDGKKTVCAHTNKEKESWWMIDLQGVYNVSSIAIYNNVHHNVHMTGARIHIGYSCKNNGIDNKLVTTITDFKKGCWNVYQTNTSGRYITVFLPKNEFLILCEVRINGKKKEPTCVEDFFQPNDNWITFQSSDDTESCSGGAADRHETNCAAILEIPNSLWRIDLLGVYNISSVAVYNKDLDNADMSDAWIQIGNSRMKNTNKRVTNITDFKKGCWNFYQTNTSGRYITVFLPRKEDFSLCEVRINGKKKEPTCVEDFSQPNDNWITFQSSESCSGGAVDRHETNSAAILKIPNSLWRIDLLGVYNISSVAVYNKDLDNADMSDAWIQIGNSRMNNTEPNTNKRVTNITDFKMGCWNFYQTNTSGRYITVFLPRKEDFSLCEVRINGKKKESPFVLIKETKTWENALEYCRTNYRDLASIRNEEEQAWAELEAKEATNEYVWLGLHYTCVLEFWFWVADYPLDFHHWAPEGMTEDCDISVAMKKTEDHQWFSQSVYDKFHFLCEKRNQCLV